MQVADTRGQQRCTGLAHEHLRLGVVGQLRIRDDTKTGFSAFQSSEFDFNRDTRLCGSSGMSTALEHNTSVREHRLSNEHTHLLQVFLVGVRMTRIYHDGVEGSTSLRKAQCRIDILLGSRVVQMDRNRDRSGMREVDAEREEGLAAPV